MVIRLAQLGVGLKTWFASNEFGRPRPSEDSAAIEANCPTFRQAPRAANGVSNCNMLSNAVVRVLRIVEDHSKLQAFDVRAVCLTVIRACILRAMVVFPRQCVVRRHRPQDGVSSANYSMFAFANGARECLISYASSFFYRCARRGLIVSFNGCDERVFFRLVDSMRTNGSVIARLRYVDVWHYLVCVVDYYFVGLISVRFYATSVEDIRCFRFYRRANCNAFHGAAVDGTQAIVRALIRYVNRLIVRRLRRLLTNYSQRVVQLQSNELCGRECATVVAVRYGMDVDPRRAGFSRRRFDD